jgi:hypothetical protein
MRSSSGFSYSVDQGVSDRRAVRVQVDPVDLSTFSALRAIVSRAADEAGRGLVANWRSHGRAPRGRSFAMTATGTAERNVDGQAISLTVFSTVRWWGRIWLPALFAFIRYRSGSLRILRGLSFIHFARWTLVTRLPYNGPPQPERRLRYPHLFFESNFNGGWEEYIDAFSFVLTRGMGFFWRSSYGFPGALPTGPFKDYIRSNELQASHYFSAYPQATVTTIDAARQLEPKVQALGERTTGCSPEEFEAQWQTFLTDVQGYL